jgi:hypothetical protein
MYEVAAAITDRKLTLRCLGFPALLHEWKIFCLVSEDQRSLKGKLNALLCSRNCSKISIGGRRTRGAPSSPPPSQDHLTAPFQPDFHRTDQIIINDLQRDKLATAPRAFC